MRTIYKYPLSIIKIQDVEMKKPAKILHIGFDPNHKLCIWAYVNTEEFLCTVRFIIIGTGDPARATDFGEVLPQDYLTSVMDGESVWHIFRPHFN